MKIKKSFLLAAGITVLGMVLLFVFANGVKHQPATIKSGGAIWTCSMHPQVRLPKPGKCPICGMPLILATKTAETNQHVEHGIQLSQGGATMAGVETATVVRRELFRVLHAIGKIEPNERTLANVVVRFDGFAEKLHVDFTGVYVKQGDHLIDLYSPELLVAQQELLTAARGEPQIAQLVRAKLLRLGLTSDQVQNIAQTGKVQEVVTLYSPITGTVIEKVVIQKNAVKAGDILYRVANLDSVWVTLDIFESDLPLIRYGQVVEVNAEGALNERFQGRVWFISPKVTEETRTVKVVVTIANKNHLLRPGMYITASLKIPLQENGSAAPTGVEGMFTCPMHPDVLEVAGGKCPVCAMDLVKIPGGLSDAETKTPLPLAVPTSSILDAGSRKIVMVEKGEGFFVPVQVKVGPASDGFQLILSGVAEGDKVAESGNFLLDSQLQVSGRASLFHPEGQAPSSGHNHGSNPAANTPVGKSQPQHAH